MGSREGDVAPPVENPDARPGAASRIVFLKPTLVAGPLIAAAAAVLVLFAFDPVQSSIFPVCMFHRLTGLNCPGCGATRALHQLLHGHLKAAFHFNALLIVSLPVFAWLSIRFAWLKRKSPPASFAIRPLWFWIFLAVVVAFGIVRNLPFAPFNRFAI